MAEASKQRTASYVRERLFAIAGRLNIEHVRTAATVGRWTWRVSRVRSTVRQSVHALQDATLAYLSAVSHLTYSVVPSPSPPATLLRPAASVVPDVSPATGFRARIIANPTSGTIKLPGVMRELEETAAWLTERGLPTELSLTERPGHAQVLAREATEQGMELVIAAGGDGTINDIIQSLAGHTTALGVLPVGTVNVWARETGIPLNLHEARNVLLHGARRRVDLGRANARYFLLMAGIGLDAEATRRVEQSRLKRLGLKALEYLAAVSMLSLTSRPARIVWQHNGRRHNTSALMVIVGNTRLYGGAFTFTTNAVADDGLLDVVIIGGGGLVHRARVFLRAFFRRPSRGPQIRYERGRTVRLESNPPLPVQVDGELHGTLPMTFSIAPLALTVVVPHSAPTRLFSRPLEV